VTVERAVFLRERFGVAARTMEPVGEGWDSDTYEVDDRWIFRFPRRARVEERVRREIRFLPELADALSVAVPRFEFVSRQPVVVGYRKLEGTPLPGRPSVEVAGDVGRFLSELHSFPVERARHLGVAGAGQDVWRADLESDLAEFRERVLPLLHSGERRTAGGMLDRFEGAGESFAFAPALIHADLGPEHLLAGGERLSGVIDWSDTRIGDPALDFAWLLHGPDEPFADELLRYYEGAVDAGFRGRALFFHRLGPWHEVVYGLETGRREYLESGVAGLRSRLANGRG
jgi:aminoglycoside phosphotransferase (APT) family kinase protein